MAKCTFCGTELTPGTGMMYVQKDGKILYFDKSKCRKNQLQLKRNVRKVKWTAAHRSSKGKEK